MYNQHHDATNEDGCRPKSVKCQAKIKSTNVITYVIRVRSAEVKDPDAPYHIQQQHQQRMMMFVMGEQQR
jgi:hypothetical protein